MVTNNACLFGSEANEDSSNWVEIGIWLCGHRKAHHSLITDNGRCGIPKAVRNFREFYVASTVVQGNMPMVVDIPKHLQSPKMGQLISAPMTVRLKRLHNGSCAFGNVTDCVREPVLRGLPLIDSDYGETSRVNRLTAVGSYQAIDEVVQRGAQAADEIAKNCADRPNIGSLELDLYNILVSRKIVIGYGGMRLGINERANLNFERI